MRLPTRLLTLVTLATAVITSPEAEDCRSRGEAACGIPEQEVRAVLEAAMKCQQIRQLHAVVVHNGSKLYSFQLQVKDGKVVDIQQEKLLVMASVSKGMLGTALAPIQDFVRKKRNEPRFDLLKTPLRRIFGDDFWFVDQTRTQLVNLEDLLSHSTGLARHDSMWYLYGVKSKEEVMKYTCRLQSYRGFRQSFLYNNLVWTVADLALQRLTGMNYTEYMRRFLWRPLGMNDTYGSTEIDKSLRDRVFINSFFTSEGIPFDTTKLQSSTDLVEAAGGVLASLKDVVKYMKYHTSAKYTSVKRLPIQFGPVNAHVSEIGFNSFLSREFYQDSVQDFPDLEVESYSKGWFRTWYRDNLVYNHGGTLFGVRCELDIFLKRRFGVFVHTNLGGDGAVLQAFYASILNKYFADLILMGKSFVTAENVCSLFKDFATEVVAVPLRSLTASEVKICTGRFGNFGFGSVDMYWNASSERINAVYGIAKFELLPINWTACSDTVFEFFMRILEPLDADSAGSDVQNLTSTHLYLLNTTARMNHLLATVIVHNNETVLLSPTYESSTPLVKGLEPDTWRRPDIEEACSSVASLSCCLVCLAVCLTVCLLTRAPDGV